MEEWRDISGYEGIYQISNGGKVKRITDCARVKAGHILRPWLSHGYPTVQLHKDGVIVRYRVHRLVAAEFVENFNPEINVVVNHKNGVRHDNHHLNLEWCTPSENIKHSYRVLGKAPSMGMAKLTEQDVKDIRKLLSESNLSHRKIAPMFNVTKSVITAINTNVSWTHVK